MAKSFCNLLYHIVFATADREPWFDPDIRPRVHQYLGGTVKRLGGIPLAVGGVADHVHLLCKLRQDAALAAIVRDLKANSSTWFHETFRRSAFRWQGGYGAFTVSASQADGVRHYIATQEAHHRKVGYQAEFVALLDRHGVEYDARYLWT